MHLILAGATGLVGSAVLHEMIGRESISQISVLSRRQVPMAEGHEKVHVIIHKDFKQYPDDVMEKLRGAEGVVWALGVSANDVSKDVYEEITCSYSDAAAKAFASLADPFKFVYVSGEGATTTPMMLTPFFGKVKGRAEASLLSLSQESPYTSLRPFSVRPAGVDSSAQPEIWPFIPSQEGLAKKLVLPIMRNVYSSMHSPTNALAKVLVDLAMSNGEELKGEGISGNGRTVSNKAMRRLAGI